MDRRGVIVGAGLAPLAAALPARAEGAALRPELAGLARLIGNWTGEGEGEPGRSTLERRYEAALGGKFLHAHHSSRYAPQPKNPKGEVHHNLDFIGFDKARKRAVFRQFHTEGFVAQYAAATTDLAAAEVVFESESIENIPAGFRARETYRFTGPDSFEEVFELAEPGKGFALYAHNRFRRA